MPTYYLHITGKVQGVFFRATAKDIALKNNLKGWIKNNKAGEVEAMVSGAEDACAEFIIWCKSGPPLSRIDEVKVTPQKEIDFEEFKISR